MSITLTTDWSAIFATIATVDDGPALRHLKAQKQLKSNLYKLTEQKLMSVHDKRYIPHTAGQSTRRPDLHEAILISV